MDLACTHAGVWPVNHGACSICFKALREENSRMKSMLLISKPELLERIGRLTRERDEARDQVAALKTDNYRINKHRDELEAEVERLQKAHDHQHGVAGTMLREAERWSAEVARLEGLILNAQDGPVIQSAMALYAEARRIRAAAKGEE